MKRYVGNFDIVSSEVIVSDPCYDKGTWCTITLGNVKNGNWESYITGINTKSIFGRDVELSSEILAIHNDYIDCELKWEHSNADIGVDSGQVGIYDKKYYSDDSIFNGEKAIYNDISDVGFDAKNEIEFSNDIINEKTEKLKDPNLTLEERKSCERSIEWHNTTIDVRKTKLSKVFVSENEWDGSSLWYAHNCAKTSGVYNPPNPTYGMYYDKNEIIKLHGGVIPYGTVSSSGYGDGSYDCYTATVGNKIVGIKVIFIDSDK